MAAPATRKVTTGEVETTLTGATLEAFQQLVFMVPEGEDDGANGLIGAILGADTWDGANGLDKLPSSKDLVGKRIVVQTVKRRQSDQPSATGYYLIAEGYDKDDHRPVIFSAGGEQAVAMLAKAHASGWLPVAVSISSTTTKSGNDAVNVKFLEIRVKSSLDQ